MPGDMIDIDNLGRSCGIFYLGILLGGCTLLLYSSLACIELGLALGAKAIPIDYVIVMNTEMTFRQCGVVIRRVAMESSCMVP